MHENFLLKIFSVRHRRAFQCISKKYPRLKFKTGHHVRLTSIKFMLSYFTDENRRMRIAHYQCAHANNTGFLNSTERVKKPFKQRKKLWRRLYLFAEWLIQAISLIHLLRHLNSG